MGENVNDLCLYFRKPPEEDRFFPLDRFIRPPIRRLIRGNKIGGVEKVFVNLCKGLKKLGINFVVNKPFSELTPTDKVIVLGSGRYSLEGYNKRNKIVAGIGLMTHPSQWPDLVENYPIQKYLQHSEWANKVYERYYGRELCDIWFAGIDTDEWKPHRGPKQFDILIYNKVRWEKERLKNTLVDPIKNLLKVSEISFQEIVYGSYTEPEYYKLLKHCKAMIFLCEHESQGFACCEALSMNVPVLAWDNGFCLDPNRFEWQDPVIPATSVPFFDKHCGEKFVDFDDFENKFGFFYRNVLSERYNPRDFILQNLTLEKSAERMLEIINS